MKLLQNLHVKIVCAMCEQEKYLQTVGAPSISGAPGLLHPYFLSSVCVAASLNTTLARRRCPVSMQVAVFIDNRA